MFRNPLIDFAVLLLAALLIFGPKRLPGLGRGLGQGMKEFKDGLTGKSSVEEDEQKPALTAANSSSAGASAAPAGASTTGDGARTEPAAATTDPGAAEVGSSEPRA